MKNRFREVTVLLIEDNEYDVALVQNGLQEAANGTYKLQVIADGEQALRYFETNQPRPDLVILDLNIPGVTGFDLLKYIKGNPDLREIPVIIFSTSTAARDIRRAYNLSANGYVRKPADLYEFLQAVGAIKRFWVDTAMLPGQL